MRYLQDLTLRLARGVASLSEERRSRLESFFLGLQREDGGWAGREGESDPYYTGFALRALSILGGLSGEPARRATAFLRGRLEGREALVDFFSLLYGAELLKLADDRDVFEGSATTWREEVVRFLESLRRGDGGFAKTAEGDASSTYQTFLVLIALELLENPVREPERVVSFIFSQQTDDGGFREIRAARRGGTNPTAAAIGTLRMLGVQEAEVEDRVIDFLLDRQNEEGGLSANTRIPIADVLSTFTGMVTLADLEALHELDLESVERFVDRLEQPSGGFRAADWDTVADVEYSFYALGSLALLAEHRESERDVSGQRFPEAS